MSDNPIGKGFRLIRKPHGVAPIPAIVATGTAFNVNNGAQGVTLRQGDPIYQLSTGGVTLCPGTETTQVKPCGIVATVYPYYNSTTGRMELGEGLPSGVAWGTNLERQSKISYWPLEGCVFEVDCDDNDQATTLAAYQAFINENCDHKLCGESGGKYALPRLDISTHATTATLMWRIVGVSTYFLNDPAEHYFKLLVKANLIGDAPFTALGN